MPMDHDLSNGRALEKENIAPRQKSYLSRSSQPGGNRPSFRAIVVWPWMEECRKWTCGIRYLTGMNEVGPP